MIRILLNDVVFKEEFASWDEITTVLTRSEDYHGKMMTHSLDIRLIQSAYDFVTNLDNLYDAAAECTCVIQSYSAVDGWTDDFSGLLDFLTLEPNNTDETKGLTINAYDNDFANRLIEYADTEIPYDRLETLEGVEITPFDNEYISVNIDGVESVSTGTGAFEIMELRDDDLDYVDNMWPTITMDSDDESIVSTSIRGNCYDDRFGSANFSYYADDVDAIVTIELQLSYFYLTPNSANPPTTFYIKKAQKRTDGTLSDDGYNIYTDTIETLFSQTVNVVTAGVAVYNNIDINQAFNLEDGYGIYFQFSRVEGTECEGGYMEIESNDTFNITIAEKAPATPCEFVPPFELGQRIIEGITGQANGLDAPIFGRTDSPTVYDEDGEGALLFATNGKLIRQFPSGYTEDEDDEDAYYEASQMASSFSDWFENYDKVLCLGAGIKYEDGQYKLYVDDRKEFYKNELVYTVTELEAKSFEKPKLLDLYFNGIEVGSEYDEPEDTSGLEEYNSIQNYSTPVVYDNTLELATDWIYAANPFEHARRKPYESGETTDYKYDTDNFLFQVYRDGDDLVQWSDQDFEEINGLDNITTYINLKRTPQRILRERYGWWLNTCLRGYQDDKITYNTSDVVTDLSTRMIDETESIVENGNIQISDLDSSKFTGRIVRFSAPVSSATLAILDENFYGVVKYPDPLTETDGYMYLKEVSTNIVDKATNWEGWEITGFSETESYRLLQDGSYRLLENGGIRLLED